MQFNHILWTKGQVPSGITEAFPRGEKLSYLETRFWPWFQVSGLEQWLGGGSNNSLKFRRTP